MGQARSMASGRRGGRRGKTSSRRRRLFRVLLTACAAALVARAFFVQFYRVPSRSMEDSLLAGELLLVDTFSYGVRVPLVGWRLPGLADPTPGDVVVFRHPQDPRRVYVKRCIATQGQRVEIRDKTIYVEGVRQADPTFSKYVDSRIVARGRNPRDNYGPEPLPEGSIFVMGDNRDNSRDSRHWGALSRQWVVGQPIRVIWSCASHHVASAVQRSSVPPTALDRALTLPRRIRWSRLGDAVP